MTPTNTDKLSIGSRLREERIRLGYNQCSFADAIQVSRSTQVGYEKGFRTPDLEYANRAEQLGVDICYLRTGIRKSLRAFSNLDWDLYKDLDKAITECALQENIEIPRHKRLDLQKFLYARFSKDKVIDHEAIRELLRLST